MSDLFHNDRAGRKRGFLRVVAGQSETLGLICDHVGGDRWVVRDLFDHKRRASPAVLVRPVSVEKFTKDGVERPVKPWHKFKSDRRDSKASFKGRTSSQNPWIHFSTCTAP